VSGGSSEFSLESAGGSSLEEWPADPPLQQVVLEPLGNPAQLDAPARMAALGVGMSGHGHWSLAADSPPDAQETIQFDWACRIHQPAERLGSTYRASTPDTITEEVLVWRLVDGGTVFLQAIRGRLHWDEVNQAVTIEPTSDVRTHGTHCWCYRLGFE
jgi:hypothetical protein